MSKNNISYLSKNLLCSLFVAVCMCAYAGAQEKLAQQIKIPAFKNTSIRDIFEQIKSSNQILFSYNSQLINQDSIVNVPAYTGVLVGYLENLLGDQFSFKETTSHVIISYSPQKMDVDVHIPAQINNRVMITGYIKDIRTNKAIQYASIYDKNAFVSTLTDKNGYFELDIKKPEQLVAISMSKENYRDTSIILLLPIEATKLAKKGKLGYYSDYNKEKGIFTTYLGNLFSNSSRKIQSLNLGGVFAYSPFQVSMTPGLSTHGFFESQVVNKFSLNVLGGYTAGVDGFEIGGALNINQYNMRGTQIGGLVNVVGGNVKGLQLAGAGNVVVNDLSGVQIGGLWNKVDTVKSGLQLAGALNIANSSQGSQIAGLVNVSRSEVSNQLAGAVNVAKKVKGVQIAGLINIADSSDYPIGLFNLIKNGYKELSVSADESKLVSLNFRSGGRVLYSLISAGYYWDDPDLKYALEFGVGANMIRKKKFSLAAELISRTSYDEDFKNDYFRAGLRVIPRFHLSKHLAIYAAPSFHYSEHIVPDADKEPVKWKFFGSDKKSDTFHGGGSVGLVFNW